MQQQIDAQRAREFAGQLLGLYTGGILSFMVDIGYKTGLLEAAAQACLSVALQSVAREKAG